MRAGCPLALRGRPTRPSIVYNSPLTRKFRGSADVGDKSGANDVLQAPCRFAAPEYSRSCPTVSSCSPYSCSFPTRSPEKPIPGAHLAYAVRRSCIIHGGMSALRILRVTRTRADLWAHYSTCTNDTSQRRVASRRVAQWCVAKRAAFRPPHVPPPVLAPASCEFRRCLARKKLGDRPSSGPRR